MRRRIPALLLLVVMWCGSCARPPLPERAAAPILLGAIYPLTGPQAQGGKEEYAGVRTALQLANDAGGVNGRHVALVVKDAPTPQAGVAAVDALTAQHLPAILGSYSSIVAVAASAEADRRHVVWWETGAVADEVTARHLPYVFRTVATGSSLGRTSARFTAEVLLPAWHLSAEAARVAIVYEGDIYGQSVAAGAAEEASARGLHVVDTIRYDAGGVDPTALAERIAADRPDFLWDASYLADGVALWRAVVAGGIHLKGAIGTSSAFCMPEFGQQLGPLATGLFASDKPDDAISPDALSPPAQALLERARAAYRRQEGREMGIPAMAGFVGAWSLLQEVLPRAGVPTPDAIRAAASAIDLPSGSLINGAGLRFAPPQAADGGQNSRAVGVVGQWQPDGMRIVYPAQYRVRDPLILAVPAAVASR